MENVMWIVIPIVVLVLAIGLKELRTRGIVSNDDLKTAGSILGLSVSVLKECGAVDEEIVSIAMVVKQAMESGLDSPNEIEAVALQAMNAMHIEATEERSKIIGAVLAQVELR